MMTAALVSIISRVITSQQFFLYNSITFISISITSIPVPATHIPTTNISNNQIYDSGYKRIWNFGTNLCRRMSGSNRPSDKSLYE